MTHEEIKEYLKNNLKIEFYPYKSCDTDYLGVRLVLNGEVISTSESFTKYW